MGVFTVPCFAQIEFQATAQQGGRGTGGGLILPQFLAEYAIPRANKRGSTSIVESKQNHARIMQRCQLTAACLLNS